MEVVLVNHTIYGICQSKSNSRRLVTIAGKPRFIKSSSAIAFETAVKQQVPAKACLMEGDLGFHADIYYPTRRQDLDPSVVLDALQGLIYKTERQIKKISSARYLDKHDPRVEFSVWKLEDYDEKGPTQNQLGQARPSATKESIYTEKS